MTIQWSEVSKSKREHRKSKVPINSSFAFPAILLLKNLLHFWENRFPTVFCPYCLRADCFTYHKWLELCSLGISRSSKRDLIGDLLTEIMLRWLHVNFKTEFGFLKHILAMHKWWKKVRDSDNTNDKNERYLKELWCSNAMIRCSLVAISFRIKLNDFLNFLHIMIYYLT